MFLNVLAILLVYYMVKPLREGWISLESIEGLSKMEVKAYSSYGQSLLLLFVVAYYDHLVNLWPRTGLIIRSTIFCMIHLVLFWIVQPGLFFDHIPGTGIAFYLWVGMFGGFMVAQTWTFVVDLYNDERGRRILPLIAIGGTVGAVTGSWMVERLISTPYLGIKSLLLLALIPLAATIWLSRTVDEEHSRSGVGHAPGCEGRVPKGGRLFDLVMNNRFLLGVAVTTLFLNWVNSNGENILFRMITDNLEVEMNGLNITDPSIRSAYMREKTVLFYGNFFFWVNTIALLLQSLVASRLLKYGGFAVIMLMLPLLVLTSSIAMAVLPILAVIKVMKIAENATDYSINNTARHVLWLPLSLEVKFKAKTAIDSLFVRIGDGLAAFTVVLGSKIFVFSIQDYLLLNVFLVMIWLAGTIMVVQEHRRITERKQNYAIA